MVENTNSRRETYRHGNVRVEAIKAAISMLEEAGYEKISLRQVASHVGVAHRAISNEFGDKTQFLNAIATAGFEQQAAAVQPAATKTEFLRAYLQFGLDHPHLYALMTSRPHATMKLFPELQSSVHLVITKAMDLFAESKADKAEKRRAVMKIYTLLHGALSLRSSGILDLDTDEEFIAELEAMLSLSE